MNKKFVNVSTGEYAPDSAEVEIKGIKRRILLGNSSKYMRELGYLPVKDERPPIHEGSTVTPSGWKEIDGFAVRTYTVTTSEPTPRTVDRVKLLAVCTQLGIWSALKEWMQNSTIRQNGIEIPVWDAFIMADDEKLTEGTTLFDAWFAHAKYYLHLTDEEGEAVLEASKKE